MIELLQISLGFTAGKNLKHVLPAQELAKQTVVVNNYTSSSNFPEPVPCAHKSLKPYLDHGKNLP
eukprot:5856247-Amphidinium_carterae.2